MSCSWRLIRDPLLQVDAPTTALSTPLAAAAGQGHQAVMQALIEAGANLDSQAQNGHTPLHCAAGAGHVACVEELASAGCDLDVQNQNSNTALHVASSKGAPSRIRISLHAFLGRLVAAPRYEHRDTAVRAPHKGTWASLRAKLGEQLISP